ncbi:MAG: ferritin-like domain-containing protein [Candidatus Melainabacteria bacterium]|nr:ferritin-like domain-containing protein [Candidatus Melainabacteria bacterium]
MATSNFLSDVKALRERARKNVQDGPVIENYKGNREKIISILNEALATELLCVLRYRQHHFTAKGMNSEEVAAEFMIHSQEEQGHADRIAARISQLDGNPDMNPANITGRSHAQYVECDKLEDMIRENLVAERIAIESYLEMIHFIGDSDPTTRRMLEEILAVEEEHADDLANLLK